VFSVTVPPFRLKVICPVAEWLGVVIL